jgi:hypothetical protein
MVGSDFLGTALRQSMTRFGLSDEFILPETKAAYVVATDATPETLDIAQKRITARNVDFDIADAYAS